MALLTQAPKGTQDILPGQSEKWQVVEEILRSEASTHGFEEIRTPVFEHTELFHRGVGEVTDIVQKEMYTFLDKGNRSITLRPEGTASAVRSFLEHALYNDGLPVRLYYLISCYRYEKPQAGRLREFHQFGAEMFGTQGPVADAEVICLAQSIFDRIGLKNISLEINSVGCPSCRTQYYEALKLYFGSKKESLCPTCLERLERNPMRILDCKNPQCAEIAKLAPVITQHLCKDCQAHFNGVQAYLNTSGVAFTVNPTIVRGLDYYTNTVFEFVSHDLGAQSTVCGGGRYNNLIETMGGKPMPALGFAIGLERLLMIIEAQGISLSSNNTCELYIASMGEDATHEAFRLKNLLQQCGVHAQCDLCGRGLKAQMKFADKIHAKYTLVLGDNEIASGVGTLKDMKTGEKTEISIKEKFLEDFIASTVKAQLL